jgi:uncharacterized protein
MSEYEAVHHLHVSKRLPKTERTEIHREPERGSYERSIIHAILDEALICHVGLSIEGRPLVFPTICARVGERVYMHGSPDSAAQKAGLHGDDICVTVSLLDGFALARTAVGHDLAYRSVMIFGKARAVIEPEEKRVALRAISEQVAEGLWEGTREPSDEELAEPALMAIELEAASAKIAKGPPLDPQADQSPKVWSGVVRLTTVAEEPEASPGVAKDVPVPAYVPRGKLGRRI